MYSDGLIDLLEQMLSTMERMCWSIPCDSELKSIKKMHEALTALRRGSNEEETNE